MLGEAVVHQLGVVARPVAGVTERQSDKVSVPSNEQLMSTLQRKAKGAVHDALLDAEH